MSVFQFGVSEAEKLAVTWRLTKRLICLLTGFLLSSNVIANEEPEAPLWVSNVAQVQSDRESDKNSSAFGLENRLFQYLNSFFDPKFNLLNANYRRTENVLDSYANACSGNKLKTEERLAKFPMTSFPQTIFLGQRLYVSSRVNPSSLEAYLTPNGTIQLERLLKENKQLVLGLEDGRSYGDKADRVFEMPENQPNIFIRHGDGTAQGVVEMWLADRIHMLIEYPAVFKHYQSASKFKETGFTSYPVEELEAFHAGYVMCSATPQGQMLVTNVDEVIAVASQHKAYLQLHLDYYSEDKHDEVTRLYNQVFNTHF